MKINLNLERITKIVWRLLVNVINKVSHLLDLVTANCTNPMLFTDTLRDSEGLGYGQLVLDIPIYYILVFIVY